MRVKIWKPWHFWGRKQNKTMGILFILSHLEPIILVLISLEKTCTFLMIDQILLCTTHLFKILVISAETGMHLLVLSPNLILLRIKIIQWGWISTEGAETTYICILKFHACLWFFGFMHYFMLFLLLPCRKLPFAGSKLFGYCFFKSVCMFEVSSR